MVIPLDCNYGLAHIYMHEHGAAGSGPNRPPLFNKLIAHPDVGDCISRDRDGSTPTEAVEISVFAHSRSGHSEALGMNPTMWAGGVMRYQRFTNYTGERYEQCMAEYSIWGGSLDCRRAMAI